MLYAFYSGSVASNIMSKYGWKEGQGKLNVHQRMCICMDTNPLWGCCIGHSISTVALVTSSIL